MVYGSVFLMQKVCDLIQWHPWLKIRGLNHTTDAPILGSGSQRGQPSTPFNMWVRELIILGRGEGAGLQPTVFAQDGFTFASFQDQTGT